MVGIQLVLKVAIFEIVGQIGSGGLKKGGGDPKRFPEMNPQDGQVTYQKVIFFE